MLSHLSEFFAKPNRAWVIIRSDLRIPPPPHMYIYKHSRICIDTYKLIVAFAFYYIEVGCILVNKRMVRALGIEPRTPAWKAGVLPLNYARVQSNI